MAVTPAIVDVHMHAYETAEIGIWSKETYEIWEYGQKDVAYSPASGVLDEVPAVLGASGVDHGVVVTMFSIDESRDRWLAGVDRVADRAGVHEVARMDVPPLGERLKGTNEWLVEAAASMPEITPFVAVDPWLLSPTDLNAHLEDMCRRGARGVKIHSDAQRFLPDDPRMLPVYRTCADLDLVVLAHGGASQGGVQLAEPSAFVAVARAVPELRLVVAHMGGASWRQLPALAAACPQVCFDLSEIVAWTGAPAAPTEAQLVQLIRTVGVERVLFGSDFPWYDPGVMVAAIHRLPGLTDGELAAILGGNATRLLDLA